MSFPRSCTPVAERMRRFRQRRKEGMRCVKLLLRITEIDGLIRLGYLMQELRNDPGAIQVAAETLISDALYEGPWRLTSGQPPK
jgi:hypothetical protein